MAQWMQRSLAVSASVATVTGGCGAGQVTEHDLPGCKWV